MRNGRGYNKLRPRDEVDSFLKGSPGQKRSLRREEERHANWGLEGMCVAVQRSLRHSSTVKSSDDGEKNVGGESETEGALDGRKNKFFWKSGRLPEVLGGGG